METEIPQKIALLEEKVDKIFVSVEKTRKYFKWTMIVTLVIFVLPLIAMMFVIPSFMTNYVDQIQSLSQ
ncbi:MAG TPA: hypothetical protein VJC13_03490 [Candidatus Paceibacterota bacterium]